MDRQKKLIQIQEKRNNHISKTLRERLPKRYIEHEKRIFKKYKLDKEYDKNLGYGIITSLIIGVISIYHPEISTFAIILSLACVSASLLVVVRNLTYKTSPEKQKLIRNEINHNFKKELKIINQEFEHLDNDIKSIDYHNPK